MALIVQSYELEQNKSTNSKANRIKVLNIGRSSMYVRIIFWSERTMTTQITIQRSSGGDLELTFRVNVT